MLRGRGQYEADVIQKKEPEATDGKKWNRDLRPQAAVRGAKRLMKPYQAPLARKSVGWKGKHGHRKGILSPE